MPFIIGGIIAGAGAIGGALISSSGAQSAANTAAGASQNATNAQLQMFNTTEANTAPERALGAGASGLLANMYGISGVNGSKGGAAPNYSAFYKSPGYQFQLQQGNAAINKQAAAGGGLYSSNTLNAQGNYAQGLASTSYNNYLQSLMQMAGLGNASNATSAGAATATGAGISNSIMSGGNALAAGQIGSANAFGNAITSLGNNPTIANAFGGQGGGNFNFAPGYQPGGNIISPPGGLVDAPG